MSKMAEILVRLRDSSDPNFLLVFYRLLLDSIAKLEQWSFGEKIAEKAFTIVPNTHQRLLWESLMLFTSK